MAAAPLESVRRHSSLGDRTHHGGAVLWFMRRHAPMPDKFARLLPDEHSGRTSSTPTPRAPRVHQKVVESPEPLTLAGRTRSTSSAARSSHPVVGTTNAKKCPDVPENAGGLQKAQRKFLHETLRVISAELDAKSVPSSAAVGTRAASARSEPNRHNLRRRYAAHAEFEVEQLEAAVAARDAEVTRLQREVEHMENLVEATRAASVRRAARLGKSGKGSGDLSTDKASMRSQAFISSLGALIKTRKSLISHAGTQVFDAEPTSPTSEKDKQTAFDEWEQSLDNQKVTLSGIHTDVEEKEQQMQQQTVQRKAMEVALFGRHAEILRLRQQVMRMEARVSCLACELRKVYRNMPETLREQLERLHSRRDEQKSHELQDLQQTFRKEHFKFMQREQLVEEINSTAEKMQDMKINAAKASEILQHSEAMASTMVEHSRAVLDALEPVRAAWAKLTSQRYTDARDREVADNGQALVQEATLTATALNQLLVLIEGNETQSCTTDSWIENSTLMGSTVSRLRTPSRLHTPSHREAGAACGRQSSMGLWCGDASSEEDAKSP